MFGSNLICNSTSFSFKTNPPVCGKIQGFSEMSSQSHIFVLQYKYLWSQYISYIYINWKTLQAAKVLQGVPTKMVPCCWFHNNMAPFFGHPVFDSCIIR